MLNNQPKSDVATIFTAHNEQGRRDSNPQPPVLETGALPIELLPYRRGPASRPLVSDATVADPAAPDYTANESDGRKRFRNCYRPTGSPCEGCGSCPKGSTSSSRCAPGR